MERVTTGNRPIPLAASGTAHLSEKVLGDDAVSGENLLPPCNEWYFTNIGSGVLQLTPKFFDGGGLITSHTTYAVPANDTLVLDIAAVADWLITETGGAASSKVIVRGYDRD